MTTHLPPLAMVLRKAYTSEERKLRSSPGAVVTGTRYTTSPLPGRASAAACPYRSRTCATAGEGG